MCVSCTTDRCPGETHARHKEATPYAGEVLAAIRIGTGSIAAFIVLHAISRAPSWLRPSTAQPLGAWVCKAGEVCNTYSQSSPYNQDWQDFGSPDPSQPEDVARQMRGRQSPSASGSPNANAGPTTRNARGNQRGRTVGAAIGSQHTAIPQEKDPVILDPGGKANTSPPNSAAERADAHQGRFEHAAPFLTHGTAHPSWTAKRHHGFCGQSCPCCRASQ